VPRTDPPADVRAARATVAPADEAYVARVRDAIQQRLADPDFGVIELADAVSTDRSHLFRRVKQLFGESPSDLIRQMRLAEGERLLLAEASATVTDVAYAAGFNSLSYFCRCFQEAYGATPAAYRTLSSRPIVIPSDARDRDPPGRALYQDERDPSPDGSG
jgi:AraC-like DNA-binding protein